MLLLPTTSTHTLLHPPSHRTPGSGRRSRSTPHHFHHIPTLFLLHPRFREKEPFDSPPLLPSPHPLPATPQDPGEEAL